MKGMERNDGEPTNTTSMIRVSVIIPVWNGGDRLRSCLAALSTQSLARDRFEIIVVDNGSTDGSATVATDAGAIVVREATVGSYAARNAGIAVARGEWLAFTDADCVPDRYWLEAALNAVMTSPRAGIVAGRIVIAPGPDKPGAAETLDRIFSFQQERNVGNGVAITANWISPAALIRDLGGFRSDLRSAGDFWMARRIGATGAAIIYAPDAIVTHPPRTRFEEHVSKMRRVTGGNIATVKRGGAIGTIIRIAKETVHRLRRVATTRDLGVVMRLRVGSLVLVLAGVAVAETLRIAAGGTARRQ